MLVAVLAVLSGLLAASTAAWTKVAQHPDFEFFGYKTLFSENTQSFLRFGFFVSGNILMWLSFVTALKKSPNVGIVTALNNLSNLLLSVIFIVQ